MEAKDQTEELPRGVKKRCLMPVKIERVVGVVVMLFIVFTTIILVADVQIPSKNYFLGKKSGADYAWRGPPRKLIPAKPRFASRTTSSPPNSETHVSDQPKADGTKENDSNDIQLKGSPGASVKTFIRKLQNNRQVSDPVNYGFVEQLENGTVRSSAQVETPVSSSPGGDATKPLDPTQSVETAMLGRFKERREHMLETCDWVKQNTSLETLTARNLRYFMYNDEHKIIFCGIPKVGITNWKKVFLILSGKVNESNPARIIGASVHDYKNKSFTPPTLNQLSREEAFKRLESYSKVVFVRNPFERLLSGYRNKFVSPNPYFQKLYGTSILKTYRPEGDPTIETGEGVTFEEFLRYVSTPDLGLDANEHWIRYHKLCQPCAVKYDFIGSFDSFDEDVNFVFDHFHLREDVEYPSRQGYSSTKTSDILMDALSNVPKEVVTNVWEKYKYDFQLFGFEKPSFVS